MIHRLVALLIFPRIVRRRFCGEEKLDGSDGLTKLAWFWSR